MPNTPWAYFRIGSIVGQLQPDVYALFLEEWERLKTLTMSDKITPNFGAMVVNSIMTPTEGMK